MQSYGHRTEVVGGVIADGNYPPGMDLWVVHPAEPSRAEWYSLNGLNVHAQLTRSLENLILTIVYLREPCSWGEGFIFDS